MRTVSESHDIHLGINMLVRVKAQAAGAISCLLSCSRWGDELAYYKGEKAAGIYYSSSHGDEKRRVAPGR